MKPEYWGLGVLTVLVLLASFVIVMHGQQKMDMPKPSSYAPYKLGELPDGSQIYKMSDYGCEIYIVERTHGQLSRSDSVAAAITTGRGCK